MPFTASHAAAILPLRGAVLSTSALVMGAMAPDLPLFIPFLPVSVEQTHTIWAVLELNVVLAALMFVTWHGFLVRPLAWFAPRAVRSRLPDPEDLGLRSQLATPSRSLAVMVSLALGALTHLVWDQFTHAGTVVTSRVGIFESQIAGIPGHEVAQYVSTLVGAIIIVIALRSWWLSAPVRTVEAHPAVVRRYLSRAALAIAAIVGPVTGAVLANRGDDTSRQFTLYAVSVMPVVLVLLTSAVIAAFWHVSRHLTDTRLIR